MSVDTRELYFKVADFIGGCITYCIRVFHKRTKLVILALFPIFLFPHICRFLHYLDHMVLVDVKLEISWKRWVNFKIADFIGLVNFENENWQYWHSCIMHGLNLISCKISQEKNS